MKIYSAASVSDFFKSITKDKEPLFYEAYPGSINDKYYTLLTLFWLIDAVILIIDKAYISDKREMREGAD